MERHGTESVIPTVPKPMQHGWPMTRRAEVKCCFDHFQVLRRRMNRDLALYIALYQDQTHKLFGSQPKFNYSVAHSLIDGVVIRCWPTHRGCSLFRGHLDLLRCPYAEDFFSLCTYMSLWSSTEFNLLSLELACRGDHG